MIKRYLDLNSVLGKTVSTFIFGPRGVGKTYICNEFVKKQELYFNINLLNHGTYTSFLTNPDLFRAEIEEKIVKNKVLTVFIDEIQKLPFILDEVHYLLEKYKGNIRFILTGSSARKLKRGGANLLAGRAWTLKLHPLSFVETDVDLNKALKYGTLPSFYLEQEAPQRSLKAYIETYLKEEIMQEALVRNVDGYIRFLDIAGQMNSEPINFSKVAKQSGVSTKTAQEFFSILVDTLIAFRIDGWSCSIRKQVRQSPKYYFFDCGVLNAIRGELKTELKASSYYYGKLFETFVVQELIRLNDYTDSDYRFNYWRTNTGLEVDIIMSRGISEEMLAIEIKSDVAPTENDLHALKSFKSENPNAILYCLANCKNVYSLGEIKVYPYREGIRKIFGLSVKEAKVIVPRL